MRRNFRTYNLAVRFYHSTQSLQLTGALADQLDRAASSIALNLAEGTSRRTVKDQVRFFRMAFGSLRECQAILDLAIPAEHPAHKDADSLGAHLYRLIQNAREVAAA